MNTGYSLFWRTDKRRWILSAPDSFGVWRQTTLPAEWRKRDKAAAEQWVKETLAGRAAPHRPAAGPLLRDVSARWTKGGVEVVMGKKGCNCVSCYLEKKGEVGERTYTRAEVDAEIAAAYEAAAQRCVRRLAFLASESCGRLAYDGMADAILALTPADARQALSALLAAERERGREAVAFSRESQAHRDAVEAEIASARQEGAAEAMEAMQVLVDRARQEGAEREREECAMECDALVNGMVACEEADGAAMCADRIRARGGK